MKTPSLNQLTKFRNGEFLQFAKNMIDMYDQNHANELQLTDRLVAVQNAVNELESVFQSSMTHELSPELRVSDLQRVNLMKSIRKSIESFLLRGDKFVTSAELLNTNYQLHGSKINTLSMPQKTASINALLDDWKDMAGYPAAVEMLGLSEWTLALQEANKGFNDLYVKRVQTTQQAIGMPEKRTLIKKLMLELIQDTVAHYRLALDKKPYAKILENVNNLHGKFNAIISIRHADRKKDQPKQTTNVNPAEVVY
ncbi:MAG: DUF6261 family protein [Saprospiraceae bacterium]